jgi:transglutaminase-like putative cysteine protease
MQRYRIVHRTYYNFSAPVTLGPHSMLLRPRENHELRIESLSLDISPQPELRWHRDVEDNSVAIATFGAPAQQLAIKSDVIICQYLENPLDFLVADYAISYPFAYQPDDLVMLAPYMTRAGQVADDKLSSWIDSLWKQGEAIQTYSLLRRLNEAINRTFTYQVREEPGVQSAARTLSSGTGSCRDFALLLMSAARSLGLAARFVSGYLHVPQITGPGATHAWAEVYLPGAGWKGFDPTAGTMVGTDHIPVAVARLAESVPPVAGSFTGAATSTLEVGVWVSPC